MSTFSLNSVSFPSCFGPVSAFRHQSVSCLHFQSPYCCYYGRFSRIRRLSSLHIQRLLNPLFPLHKHQPPVSATDSSNESAISVINFEDFAEKDWTFLDPTDPTSDEYVKKIDRIITCGGIEGMSKILISFGSEGFVDRMFDSSPCDRLLVVHDSLLTLACIKEKYDKAKCWQGELIDVPYEWGPFDVVFLNFLPALRFELGQVLKTLATQCLPGARLVISHPQGRHLVDEHRRQYPDIVVSDLPDKSTLQNIASNKSFDLVEFVDESDFYLAVLKTRAKDME